MSAPRVLLAASLILGVLLPTQFARAAPPTSAVRDASSTSAPKQLLIGFVHGTTAAERVAIVAARGGTIIRTFESIDALLIEVPSGRAVASDFTADNAVRYAEMNAPVYPARIPNDPDYGNSGLWGLGKIGAPTAWETATGGTGVVVGVVDSGIDHTHPDLAANVWTAPPGWDVDGCGAGTHGFRADPGVTNCDPIDQYGHGTHVAGTIGATGDDGRGIVGVNWRVMLMPLRFMAADGSGNTAGAIAVIDYAVQAKQRGVNVRVLNVSWTTANIFVQALYDELKVASDNGILIVAAAGNTVGIGGTDNAATPSYPANFATRVPGDPFAAPIPNLIAVAASDRGDSLASFDGYASNYSASRVQLAAPGVDVYSTLPGGAYGFLSGTSMATPHVSGAAALLLSAPGFRDLTAAQLRERLLRCSDTTSGLSGKIANGRLNVARALRGDGGCAAPPTYALTTSAGSGGTVAVAPSPGPYAVGTTVAISAQPLAGYGLAGWTIDGVASSDTSNPLLLTMNGPHTAAATFVTSNAVPAIGTLSPVTVAAGSGRFVLTINGSGFARGATVRWNGTALATTFLGPTQLQALVPDTLVANGGQASIGVSNPTPGGGFTSTTFTIGPAEQSIIFDPLPSRQFSAAPFTVSATATGAPLAFSATGACAVGATTTAGSTTTATVTLTDLGDCGLTATQTGSGSAAPASVVRHFTVTQGAPTLTWAAPVPITYGMALDVTILGATASVPGTFHYAPAFGAILPAGDHTLTVTFAPDDATHYTTITRAVPLTVARASLTVTAAIPAGVYGAPLAPFSATYGGFVNGDTALVALDGALTFATDANDRSAAGSYMVTPGGLSAANYTLTFVAAPLKIAPARLTATANDWTRPTGVADPTFDVTYSGFVAGEDRQALGGELSCTTTATTTSPAGTSYPITCGGLTATNYAITYPPGTLRIAGGSAALDVLPLSALVGQQLATLVARVAAPDGAAPTGSVTFIVKQGTTGVGTPTSAALANGEASVSFPIATLAAGDYTVTATIAASGGAPAISGSATLRMVRQAQAITFATPGTHGYGESAFVIDGTASSGLAVTYATAAAGPCSLGDTTLRIDRAGICTVTAMQTGDATYLPATPVVRSFAITRAASSLHWDTPAPITYGTPLGATQLAAIAGDNRVGVTYDPPAGTILGAGTHTLTATFVPTTTELFAPATKTVTITVAPAPLTLTALDVTVSYGNAAPPSAVEVRGLVNGDSARGIGSGARPSPRGSVPLAADTYTLIPAASAGANYAIATNTGTLTVLPRVLTLTVGDATRAFGANNPAFKLRYDGFADGEGAGSLGLTPNCTTPADGGSLSGVYPIVCSLSVPTDYRLRLVPGALTVTPAPQTLTFTAPADRMLSTTVSTLAATSSSGLPVSFFVAPGSTCAVDGATLTLLSVGPCTVVARQGGDTRYAAATELARTVQILPLPAPPAPSPTPTPVPIATPIPPTPMPNPCAPSAPVTVARGSGTVSPAALCLGVPTGLTASPGNRQIFIGWAIDGTVQSYTNPIQLTLASGHTVTALFGTTQDSPALTASPLKESIEQLAARGIIKGYADGSFGPSDTTLRAQMAALIARAMGWDAEDHGNSFPDRGPVDDVLWRNVGTLAFHGVARGYSDGTYNPTAPVLRAQVVSFITRAMVTKGYWTQQPENPALYTDVPEGSGHRGDLATYVHYVGQLPEVGAGGSFAGWDQSSTRGWFALTLWAALQTQFSRPSLP